MAHTRPSRRVAHLALLLGVLLTGVTVGCGGRSGAGIGDGGQLIGAYYYVWYDPAEWRQGYLGARLTPPVRPLLGEYSSADPLVAARHIAWASEYGIDVFVVSWTGRESRTDRYLQAGLLAAPNLGDIRFAILYESPLALSGRDHQVHFDDATIGRLLADADHLALRYLSHPRYLRLAGRPVLLLYASRNFEGKHRDAITALRRRLRDHGHAVYLVGDEIFWHEPRRRRIRLFDAVTAYNMYDWPRGQFAGYGATSAFLSSVTDQYRRHRAAADEEGALFVPSVLPGYNDRGVRLAEDHYVIARRFAPDGDEGGLFARGLRQTGLDFLDDRHRLLMVTSFNEWHEWTQIEPTEPGPATTRDTSGRGRYTTGFPHAGYGFRYVELLRDAVVAVSGGVVTAPAGQPAAGVEVRALREGKLAATVHADSAGRFRFSRWSLPPGQYELTAGREPARRTVTVGATWTGPIELEAAD